ncbi:MAG: TetR/AcrR family transcriptional regulator, partial [Balneolaceae bacterium]
MPKDQETEAQIFEAAQKVFQRNGYAGARMQEIADEAGINKSMLHYYYRSKEKLFQAIFREGVR